MYGDSADTEVPGRISKPPDPAPLNVARLLSPQRDRAPDRGLSLRPKPWGLDLDRGARHEDRLAVHCPDDLTDTTRSYEVEHGGVPSTGLEVDVGAVPARRPEGGFAALGVAGLAHPSFGS